MAKLKPTIEEQRALVEEVEAYQAKRPYLTVEHVCARLGIEWSRFRYACEDVSKEHLTTKKPRNYYSLQDHKILRNRVSAYVAAHNVPVSHALRALDVPVVRYYRAMRMLKAAHEEQGG